MSEGVTGDGAEQGRMGHGDDDFGPVGNLIDEAPGK